MTSTSNPARQARLAVAVFIGGLMVGVGSPVIADNDADILAGKEIAAKACLPCHAVAPLGSADQRMGMAGPSFAEIAKWKKAAPDSLHAFLSSTDSSVGHPGSMPRPRLTDEQIRLLGAYIVSLSKSP
jgi:mono/diheme cytochrome c family protein